MHHPSSSSKFANRQALIPLITLAWAVLVYTWLLGQAPQLFHDWFSQIRHTLPAVPSPSFCLFKQLTHLPCVFCGLTRSFSLISHGHIQESFQYHLLGLPFYTATLLLALLGLWNPRQTQQGYRLLTRPAVMIPVAALLILCWFWKLGQDPRFW